MSLQHHDRFARVVSAGLLAGAATYAGLVLWQRPPDWTQDWLLALLLATAGALAASVASPRPDLATPRFTLTFALAAFALLPTPGGLSVGLACIAAGRGAGVVGLLPRSMAGAGSLAVALAVAQFVSAQQLPWDRGGFVGGIAFLTILAGLIQLVALGLAGLLDRRSPRGPAAVPLIESINVLLAWLLAATLRQQLWVPAATIALLVLTAGWAIGRLESLRGELRSTRGALDDRLTELATLHAVGREMLTSVDPDRIAGIIERECRKILAVDRFVLELAEHGPPRTGPEHEPAAETHASPRQSELSRTVLAEKRPLLIDDPDTEALGLEPGIRSVMVVPLIVQERSIGVIGVQARAARAYDEHQLSVLTTIAQQAAVALEAARHYHRATVDSLTGFHLRDYFFKRLGEEHTRATRYGGRFALLMIDLDGFKELNDLHGHLAGDRYLGRIGEVVRSHLREADLVCRYGGDEFCLMLPETDLEGAGVIAERIRAAVSSTAVGFESATLRTTVSIGISAYPQHDTGTARDLLRDADVALYRAKRNGRDCVVPFAA